MNDMSRKRLEHALGPDFEVVKLLLAIRPENRSTYLQSQKDVDVLWYMQVLLAALKAGTKDWDAAWKSATQFQLQLIYRMESLTDEYVQFFLPRTVQEDYIMVALDALEAL